MGTVRRFEAATEMMTICVGRYGMMMTIMLKKNDYGDDNKDDDD